MKVVIVEDEKPAAEKLQKALHKAGPILEVVAVLDSVKSSVEWLNQNALPDLFFYGYRTG